MHDVGPDRKSGRRCPLQELLKLWHKPRIDPFAGCDYQLV
jgi:hypothetical protein